MVNINKVYERVLFLANKEQRGYITPDEFNSFADQAQLEIFEDYLSKKLGVQTSAVMSSDEYGDPMKIIDERLMYFDTEATVTKTGNIFPFPTNFFQLGLVVVDGRMADEANNRDANYAKLSPLTAPTTKQPIYVRHEGGFKVFPDTITSIDLTYLRRPVVPVWAYMDDPSGEPIYNGAGSTQFELHPGEEDDLVYRILALSGVAIKAPDVAGFGEQNKQ